METTEKTIDIINDLVKINNDRVAGFEKATEDLNEDNLNLRPVFNKFAAESRDNVEELSTYASQYGADTTDGTSTAGALHRAWLEIKATFTGNDTTSILEECERGEDAIKQAYASALEDSGEISYEVAETIRRQQERIFQSHDLIKSLRDQSKQESETMDHNSFPGQNSYTEGDENEEWKNKPSDFLPYGSDKTGNTDMTLAEAMDENEMALANEVPAESINRNGFDNYGPTDVGDYQNTNVNRSPGVDRGEYNAENNYQAEKTVSNDSQLQEFFVNELKDLLWAERKLVDTLPKMEEAASSMELREAFHNHLAQTEEHVQRLEQIFGTLGLDPDTTKCEAMDGIVDEGEEIIDDTDEGTATRDVGLIFAGQKVEHYEIASYGGMISLANTLGYTEAVSILTMTLNEEKAADALLTQIAENNVNYRAAY